MLSFERSVRLAAPASQVWDLIGGFDAMADWHPAVNSAACWQDGTTHYRELNVVGNIRITERLFDHNDEAMSYRYGVVEGPLPVEGYMSTIKVTDNGDGTSTVLWACEFRLAGAPEDVAREAIGGIYDAGLQSLAGRFGAA
jgi:uncharacterized protein YndB with AHSA1/START domain